MYRVLFCCHVFLRPILEVIVRSYFGIWATGKANAWAEGLRNVATVLLDPDEKLCSAADAVKFRAMNWSGHHFKIQKRNKVSKEIDDIDVSLIEEDFLFCFSQTFGSCRSLRLPLSLPKLEVRPGSEQIGWNLRLTNWQTPKIFKTLQHRCVFFCFFLLAGTTKFKSPGKILSLDVFAHLAHRP